MREIGRQRRLRGPAILGLAAMVAIAVGGSLAATQASAATTTHKARAGYGGGLSISKQYFGSTVEPYTGKETAVYRYTLRNAEGMSVKILTFGGILQEINVPGANGSEADVLLGFKTLQDYVKYDSPPVTANGGPYFGELIGRYGNRIANGTFTLDQPGVGPVTYHVPINNNGNSLHGGLVGFGNHIWAAKEVRGPGSVGLQLTLVSPNGDQGYPATLKDVTTFTLNNSDQLGIHYKLTNESSNLNTVTNVTDHAYFNLAGEASPAGSAYGQLLQINADKYTPTNLTQIPLGYNVSVFGTPFNFTTPQTIGGRIDDVSAPDHAPAAYNQLLLAQGYDHNWVLNAQTPATTGPDGLNLAAHAWDPSSGRELSVWTDQPGVQVYTSNFLTGTLVGISGHTYRQGAGYTFETQHFPNSPNQPNFPSTELYAGKTFTSTTVFAFSS
ncbi:MAG TPA: aldose epimerase family protein [Streptosporangiaceae bacterium]|jgi:aldose 1-epimerase|nr:aldose epimerase family protein [Streptosporangiaceae bacterium]